MVHRKFLNSWFRRHRRHRHLLLLFLLLTSKLTNVHLNFGIKLSLQCMILGQLNRCRTPLTREWQGFTGTSVLSDAISSLIYSCASLYIYVDRSFINNICTLTIQYSLWQVTYWNYTQLVECKHFWRAGGTMTLYQLCIYCACIDWWHTQPVYI